MDKKDGKYIDFRYGILPPPLECQAQAQGYTLGDKGAYLEKVRKAINVCAFSVATMKETEKMQKKLNAKVIKALKPTK